MRSQLKWIYTVFHVRYEPILNHLNDEITPYIDWSSDVGLQG